MSLHDQRVWHPSFLPVIDLPERFLAAEPAGIPVPDIRDAVTRYVKNFWEEANRGIAPVFLGRVGQYKTYAAAVIARYANYQQLPVQFLQCGPFFMGLDANFFSSSGMRPYKHAAEIPFLVLDDFTQVKGGTRGAELLSNLLAERFAATLPTVLTGNIRGKDRKDGVQLIADQYRPDFARRLVHGAGDFYVTV